MQWKPYHHGFGSDQASGCSFECTVLQKEVSLN
jgi:hypothetical protein